MGNKWVRYLQRSENTEPGPWPLLLRKIHHREDNSCKQRCNFQRSVTEIEYPLEVASWSCITQDSDNKRNNKENVTLFWSDKCTLFLEYNLFGEKKFTLEVSSVEEAFALIEQDNYTTDKLYPNDPQFKWERIL
ncbi:hypothetical protein [Methanomethylovorans sp.]|uniref:hypothetical protein n=1 Tax=Methanomethylovorans sp. TaxID=2758717 RepID=UPI00351C51AC